MIRKISLVLILAATVAAPASEVVYTTGFETADSFTSGASIQNVDNWAVLAGDARVVTDNPQAGSQAVELTPNTVIDRTISSSNPIVWVQGWFRGTGTTGLPDFPAAPAASAIVFFSSTNGIQALNGNGTGGGTFMDSGSSLNASTWTKVALRLNYGAGTYNVYVNDASALASLGFRDSSVTQLNGFQNLASETSFFDEFAVIARRRFDANGDGSVNVGDAVAMVNEIVSAGSITNLIFRDNADTDLDGDIDATDREATVNELLGM